MTQKGQYASTTTEASFQPFPMALRWALSWTEGPLPPAWEPGTQLVLPHPCKESGGHMNPDKSCSTGTQSGRGS